ncbi:MAG: ECF transporter S component [Firmicutes bacterium]|nr:ECF transporter S component [Bacillota bacterium]
MRNKQIRRLTLGGVLAALILLLTYAVKFPLSTVGYVHAGDGAIFFAAALLGPYTALAAGVGSALADLLGGWFIFVVPTFVIKALMGGIAGMLAKKNHALRNAFVFSLGACVMVLGYYIFEGFYYGWAEALVEVGPNLLQGAAGVVIGSALSALKIRMPQ